MRPYFYGFAGCILIVLAIALGHYKKQAGIEHDRAETAKQANDTLAMANATLNARNNTLVESLNARSDELAAAQRRADANRDAYQQALRVNHRWADERVPDSVAASLRRATSGEDDTHGKGADSRRANTAP